MGATVFFAERLEQLDQFILFLEVRPETTPSFGSSSLASLTTTKPASSGDVAQLVERRTGTPLTQVRIHGALTVSVHPRVKSYALTSVRTLNIV